MGMPGRKALTVSRRIADETTLYDLWGILRQGSWVDSEAAYKKRSAQVNGTSNFLFLRVLALSTQLGLLMSWPRTRFTTGYVSVFIQQAVFHISGIWASKRHPDMYSYLGWCT